MMGTHSSRMLGPPPLSVPGKWIQGEAIRKGGHCLGPLCACTPIIEGSAWSC